MNCYMSTAECGVFAIGTPDDAAVIPDDSITGILRHGAIVGFLFARFDESQNELRYFTSPGIPDSVIGLYIGDYPDTVAGEGWKFDDTTPQWGLWEQYDKLFPFNG
jgi:hypothetical protein